MGIRRGSCSHEKALEHLGAIPVGDVGYLVDRENQEIIKIVACEDQTLMAIGEDGQQYREHLRSTFKIWLTNKCYTFFMNYWFAYAYAQKLRAEDAKKNGTDN